MPHAIYVGKRADHGAPYAKSVRVGFTAERFWAHVDSSGSPDACWPWTAARDPQGYGRYYGSGAHRIAYVLSSGEPADGMAVTRSCSQRLCCNPAHLSAVPTAETLRNGGSPVGLNARKEACPNGHPYGRGWAGRRICNACRRERRARERRSLSEYLWARIERDASGCWLWAGSIASTGYGTGSFRGRGFLAHREVYALILGEMPPETLVLDHLCRVRSCVNPAHLEPVTIAENVRRGAEARRATRGRAA